MRNAKRVSLVLAIIVLAALGCGRGQVTVAPLPDDVGPPTADPVIRVDDNVFEPADVVATVGTPVTWTWQGRALHDLDGPGFFVDPQASGTFTHTFDAPGTYAYVCTLHAGMQGVVYVVE
ncbi:MAG: hypothetical protein WD011_02045 [Nitriliruptoraceae bacterium]